MDYRRKMGEFGEKIALNYLKSKGYKIIGRNIKISFKEIDIIARIKQEIVFIEVKTRASLRLGNAEEAISSKKINHLKKAIGIYLSENPAKTDKFRLDFIAINVDKPRKVANIKHFKDIF